MNFTLKQLRYVDAAGRCSSISNASASLAISQSSVTAAIDALEDELGFNLFLRMPAKGIVPTPAGADALNAIRGFLEQAYHLDSDLRSIGREPVGALRIACYVTAAPHVLPIMLKGFARDHPGVRVDLAEGDMASVTQMLLDGTVDIACSYEPSGNERTAFMPLFAARPYAVFSAEGELAAKPSVSLAELARLPMVVLDLPFGKDYYLSLFHSRNLRPRVAHTTRSSEIVRALAAGGFGFSVLNIRSREPVEADYVCRPISDALPALDFGIISVAGTRHPRIVRTFLDHCERLSKAKAFRGIVVEGE